MINFSIIIFELFTATSKHRNGDVGPTIIHYETDKFTVIAEIYFLFPSLRSRNCHLRTKEI